MDFCGFLKFALTKFNKMETTFIQMNANDLQNLIQQSVAVTLEQFRDQLQTPLPDKIDIHEVAAMTGLRKSVIYSKTCHREIPYAKFGKRLVFSRKAIELWMQARMVQPVRRDKMVKHLSDVANGRK